MADYWKSQDRKYCEFCNAWMADNKTTIAYHENGRRHKMNVAKKISTISKNSELQERQQKKIDQEMRKMEEAALRAYANDIHAGGDFTARSVNAVIGAASGHRVAPAPSGAPTSQRQVDPMRLPGNSDDEDERVGIKKVSSETVPNASLWVEGKSPEGYAYYWNVKSGESVWEEPKEGFLSYDEYLKINQIVEQQQQYNEVKEAKEFQESADEVVARYNRERLKSLRRPEKVAEEKAKEIERTTYKTEEEAISPAMGDWKVVVKERTPPPLNLDLPQVERWIPAVPTKTETEHKCEEPPTKRFKEKVIDSLDADIASNTPAAFKKRKAKGNMRQRANE